MEVRFINNAENTAFKGIGDTRICGDREICAQNLSFKGLNIRKTTQNGLKWISSNFSSPHQRAILGITALCTQPFIDLHNKHIKKEDKPITVAKTISKIIVGTIVGVTLRHYAIKMVNNLTKNVKLGKYSQCLIPDKIIEQLKSIPEESVRKYRDWFGTLIGVTVGAFTNFLIDAPLTKILTNTIHDKFFKKEGVNER